MENGQRIRFGFATPTCDLPPSLLPRLIVESHQNVTPEARWRTGVVLTVRNCKVLVLADLDQRQVDLQVDGPIGQRRGALEVVLSDLEVVHKLNPEAEPVARVPLPDRPKVHVSYANLLKLEARFGPGHELIPDGADRTYQVRELLEGVRLRQDVIVSASTTAKNEARHDDIEKQVVILIHGIRTWALWQNAIRKALERQGFVVQPTNYGYLDLLRFLLPWQPFSAKIVNAITKQIRHTLRMNEVTSCSIVAHSFGTFVVTRILEEHKDLMFERIIFCGSVVPYRFPFEDYSHRFKHPVVNEVGTRDCWPAIAEAATIGYGSAGTYGFRRPAVKDRWHNGKAHSAFLNAEFCRKYWVPFLQRGLFIENDEDPEATPWWLRVVSMLKLIYIIIAVLLVALLWPRLRSLVPI